MLGYKVNISLPGRKITIFSNLWYKSGSVLKKRRRSHSPDELNMIDLMYQKERERRRNQKLNKNKKRRKQKSPISPNSDSISISQISSVKDYTPIGDTSVSSATPVATQTAQSDTDSIRTISRKSPIRIERRRFLTTNLDP